MKVALYGKQFKQSFNEKCSQLFSFLSQNGVDIYIDDSFLSFIQSQNIPIEYKATFSDKKLLESCDMLLSIGGDGTFLDAATIIAEKSIPIVGINTGRLGFLADISTEELPSAITDILQKKYKIREVELLKLEPNITQFKDLNFGLNELTVQKADSSSMITVHTWLNNQFLSSYWADGLIIATPTGSTAYSLSVGGPIIVPSANSFVITPIAPHNLTVRPVIVPNDVEIKLKIESRGKHFLASLDSRNATLDTGTELIIKKADFNIKIIERDKQSFYSTLRSKLMWGADKRN
ncbi:NAD kinase [Marinilabiliaceae bacterium ANBcel2]|nr:NAD kinase [Marinilabiliaceae bacterium ANBcel2]